MSHIELAAPVSHIWYFKGIPSRLGLLLDISPRALERVLYFASYIVLDSSVPDCKIGDLISEGQKRSLSPNVRVGMGAEAILELLQALDLESLSLQLRSELHYSSGQKRVRAIRRLEVVEALRKSGNKPEWMILTVIPVIPPYLRPMVQLDGGRFATKKNPPMKGDFSMSFIDNGVSDYRMQRWFQKQLLTNASLSNNTKMTLKGQAFCGTGVIGGKLSRTNNPDFAFIMTDGESARVTNVIRCHSVWACPYCAPRVMAMKATDIACAIDALSKWHNQSAIMITFTLPHWRFASCKDTLTILQDAWRMFTRTGARAGYHKYTRKDGTERVKGRAPFGSFRQAIGNTHFVRSYEVTWSPARGWHPHIHALYWVPNENFNKVLQYEKSLADNWWHCCKFCAEKYMKANHPEQYERYFHKVYSDHKKDIHSSLWISKANGKPIKQKSSMYVSGWSADAEMTGKYHAKAGNVDPNGVKHYAMHELIEEAYSMRDFPSISDKYLKLYCEFAVATRKRRRIEFSSRSGIGKIISKWKQSQTYMESVKKKLAEKPQKDWRVVVWFDQYQWSTIYNEDGLLEEILQMAVSDDVAATRQKIAKYLLLYGIRLDDNPIRYPGSEAKVRQYEARMTA